MPVHNIQDQRVATLSNTLSGSHLMAFFILWKNTNEMCRFQRMGYGHILPGEQTFNPHHWHSDTLRECENNNQVWGYIIHAREELTKGSWGEVNDPVLVNLMKMGIFDWKNKDGQLFPAAVQAIHHGTAITSRLIPHLVTLEDKVYFIRLEV